MTCFCKHVTHVPFCGFTFKINANNVFTSKGDTRDNRRLYDNERKAVIKFHVLYNLPGRRP